MNERTRAYQVIHQERHLKIVSGEKTNIIPAQYRLENVQVLHQMGAPFVEDFKRGLKSFAISSTNYKSSQQRIVLALASYFDHLFNIKIVIMSDSLHKGTFMELIRASKPLEWGKSSVELFRFHHHFDFVDLKRLVKQGQSVIEEFISDYDLVIWDTPVLGVQKEASEIFSRIGSCIESVSIVVAPSAVKTENLTELKKHFEGYGINVSGVQFKEVVRSRN